MADEPRDLLSQEEVGALFDAVRTSDDDDDGAAVVEAPSAPEQRFEPKAIDSSSAEDLGKLLKRVHGTLEVDLAAALGALLRVRVTTELDPPIVPRQHPNLGDGQALVELAEEDHDPFLALQLPPVGVKLLADLLLGGPGTVSQPERAPTPLERKVAGRALQTLGRTLSNAWRPWVRSDLVHTVQFDRGKTANGRDLGLTPIRLAIGDQTLECVLLYANPRLRAATEIEGAAGGAVRLIGDRLDGLPLKVAIRTGGFSLPVNELLSLRRGQALALGRSSEMRLDVLIEERPRFRGTLLLEDESQQVRIDEQLCGLKPRAVAADVD